ncbi:MAG: helix-turn-helix domain-containing protein [Bacteroidetes bacterium]|nr:helix-turn-helix domain-containing protein [Bacteroidota bacterium]
MQKKKGAKGQLPQLNENQRIKAIRKLLGLTQQQFASRIGISQAALSDIENEKNGISYDVFKKIVEAFHLNSDWLMYRTGGPFMPLNNELRALNELYAPGRKKTPKAASDAVVGGVEADDVRQEGVSAPQHHNLVLEQEGFTYIGGEQALEAYPTHYASYDFLVKQPRMRIPGFAGNEYMAFEVRQENMYPTIQQGDVAITSLVKPKESLDEDVVYVAVSVKQGIRIGRLDKANTSTLTVTLKSDNTNVLPVRLSRKNIVQIWKVERILTSNLMNQQNLDARLNLFEQSLQLLRNEIEKMRMSR